MGRSCSLLFFTEKRSSATARTWERSRFFLKHSAPSSRHHPQGETEFPAAGWGKTDAPGCLDRSRLSSRRRREAKPRPGRDLKTTHQFHHYWLSSSSPLDHHRRVCGDSMSKRYKKRLEFALAVVYHRKWGSIGDKGFLCQIGASVVFGAGMGNLPAPVSRSDHKACGVSPLTFLTFLHQV